MKINVRKYTNVSMLQRACSASTGKECHMGLEQAYREAHSPIRSQKFEITLKDIPQYVANQLVRQKVGAEWVMRSKRPDRGGDDFRDECETIAGMIDYSRDEEYEKTRDFNLCVISKDIRELPDRFDREAPTDLWGDLNAEALMTMAHKRLCRKASEGTRKVVESISALVGEVDSELEKHMVPQCIWRGGICPERKCCGWIHTREGQAHLRFYKAMFTHTNER